MTSAPAKADRATCAANPAWPQHRVLFLIAGIVILTGVVLTATVSTWFLVIPTIVGLNQLLFVAVGWCPMSLILGRCFGVRPAGQ